jgi:hypothetical protein
VDPGSNYRAALAVTAMAAALCGCSGPPETTGWFAKPLDPFGSRGGYTYSQLGEVKKERPITANDLVDANGACPSFVPSEQAPASAPGASPEGAPEAAARLSGGIAIGMSECDVVSRVGPPNAVNLSSTPRGDRTAVLTFNGGPRPGVYRFVGGRLKEMDRVEEPPPPAQPAKKKPAKNDKPKNNPPS